MDQVVIDEGRTLIIKTKTDKVTVVYGCGHTSSYLDKTALKLKDTGNGISIKIPSYNDKKTKKINLDYDEVYYLYNALKAHYKEYPHG